MGNKLIIIGLLVLVILASGCSNESKINLEKKCCEECLSVEDWDKPSCWVGLSNNEGSQECINFFKENPHMISDCELIK